MIRLHSLGMGMLSVVVDVAILYACFFGVSLGTGAVVIATKIGTPAHCLVLGVYSLASIVAKGNARRLMSSCTSTRH